MDECGCGSALLFCFETSAACGALCDGAHVDLWVGDGDTGTAPRLERRADLHVV